MSKLLYPVHFVNSPDQVTLKFRLQFVTDAAPDTCVPAKTCITAATRENEGIYTITLDEKFPVFIGGFGHVMVATANAVTASSHYVAIDPASYVASTGVLTFKTLWHDHAGASTGPGVLADIPNDDWVYFELTFCRTSTLAPSGAI